MNNTSSHQPVYETPPSSYLAEQILQILLDPNLILEKYAMEYQLMSLRLQHTSLIWLHLNILSLHTTVPNHYYYDHPIGNAPGASHSQFLNLVSYAAPMNPSPSSHSLLPSMPFAP